MHTSSCDISDIPGPQGTRSVLSWAVYDWANSAFAVAILSGFFPIFFKTYWNADLESTESTFRLGVANAFASLVVAGLAPFLGACADQGRAKKRFLACFLGLGVVMTACLAWVPSYAWLVAVFVYSLAILGFSGGNLFYDALLVDVSPPSRLETVSALGYSLGYLGGGLLFAGLIWAGFRREALGLVEDSKFLVVVFVGVAVWWLIFSLPLLLWTREARAPAACPLRSLAGQAWRQLRSTFGHLRELKHVVWFLLAYWLYIDGVHTIVRMAVDYGLSLGFASKYLVLALLITQFVGFPATLVMGRLGQRLGAKTGILICLCLYAGITVWSVLMQRPFEFFLIAAAIGLVQGGVQSLSRSLYARLIPEDKSGEFFGFYNMLGKFAAVVGPVLMGTVGLLTHSSRLSILSLLLMFLAGGGLLLTKVPNTPASSS